MQFADLPKELESIPGLNIDGQIDLGPKWLFEYDVLREHSTNEAIAITPQNSDEAVEESEAARDIALEKGAKKKERKRKTTNRVYTIKKNVPNYAMGIDPTAHNKRNKKKKHKSKGRTNHNTMKISTEVRKITRYYVAHKYNKRNIFIKPHRVSEDDRINNFTNHVYRDTLKSFRSIKRKVNDTDDKLKKKVDYLIQSYKEKFKEFANKTRNLKIGTRIGTQKVFLNTIDTSNRILKRLINYLAEYVKKESERSYTSIANDFDEQVNKQIRSEYNYVCTEYGICRSSDGYLEFLSAFLTEALKNDDKKLKIAVDAFIEATKNEDYSHAMDDRAYREYKNSIVILETLDIQMTKAGMMILKNMIEARNKPLEVDQGVSSGVVNKSVALMDLLDTLEKKLPPTEANKLVWNDILTRMQEWREGKREDIQNIMKTFAAHMKNCINKTAQVRVGLAEDGFHTSVK